MRLKIPKAVYVCSTRRRKPGACTNTLALPMAFADDIVLGMVEGEVLGTAYIEELLAMVDTGASENHTRLARTGTGCAGKWTISCAPSPQACPRQRRARHP